MLKNLRAVDKIVIDMAVTRAWTLPVLLELGMGQIVHEYNSKGDIYYKYPQQYNNYLTGKELVAVGAAFSTSHKGAIQ